MLPEKELSESLSTGSEPARGAIPAQKPTYRYSDLSQSASEILIEHEGQIYRLRTTRNGKLILNK